MTSRDLRIHIHGASVTAQASPGGFFHRLDESWQQIGATPAAFSRSAFGASHFDIAGYHFIVDAMSARPDICLLEWTTTSARSFDPARCDAVSAFLIANGALPVWLLLPRLDDPDGTRQTLVDAREAARRWQVPVIDLLSDVDAVCGSTPYIRDVVHTNELGGEVYARLIAQSLARLLPDVSALLEQARMAGPKISAPPVPTVIPTDAIPAHWRRVQDLASLDVEVEAEGEVEIVIEGTIGPFSPFVQVTAHSINGEVAAQRRTCLFDPWCYYERRMVSSLFRSRLMPGRYLVTLEVEQTDPRSAISLRSELKHPFEGKRHVRIDRLSLLNLAVEDHRAQEHMQS